MGLAKHSVQSFATKIILFFFAVAVETEYRNLVAVRSRASAPVASAIPIPVLVQRIGPDTVSC